MMPRPPRRGARPRRRYRRPDLPEEAERFIRRIRGDGPTVRALIAEKLAHTCADELFVMSAGPTLASRVRSLELIAQA